MPRVVVMGVAGAGKSTVGRLVADQLAVPFVDADDLHTAPDRALMASGTPLDDTRRGVWIERVRAALEERADVVIACSALRRIHRVRLQSVAGVSLYFLDVPVDELSRRLLARPAHFFPPELLASQLDTLDPPRPDEGIVVVDADRAPDAVADDIVTDVQT